MYYRLKHFEKALENLNKAIELDPEHIVAYVIRSKVKNALGDYEGSQTDLKKVKSFSN